MYLASPGNTRLGKELFWPFTHQEVSSLLMEFLENQILNLGYFLPILDTTTMLLHILILSIHPVHNVIPFFYSLSGVF